MIFSRELEDYRLNPLSSLASDNNSQKNAGINPAFKFSWRHSRLLANDAKGNYKAPSSSGTASNRSATRP